VSEEHRCSSSATHEATMRAIKAVSGPCACRCRRVIERMKPIGYNVVCDFTGHGIAPVPQRVVVIAYDKPAVEDRD